jgi:hypothetical protein
MKRIVLILAALIAVPGVAGACGGFFCSQVQMDQAGEHILFAVEGENVTAHIKIDYEGAPTSFSWVLPVPNLPEIEVGSDLLFARLRTFTQIATSQRNAEPGVWPRS